MVEKKTTPKASLTLTVYNVEGKEMGTADLPKEIFPVATSPRLIAHYVRVYLANQRQGTQSTKTRGEVIGSTRKIYRQKGTGRARHGDIKAPIFVGGGLAHGPKPRDFSLRINKKQKRKALLAVLSDKAKHGQIAVIDGLLTMAPKTKPISALLKKLSGDVGQRILFVYPQKAENLVKAVRNMPTVASSSVSSLNPYLLLQQQKILLAKEALTKL